MVRLSFFGFFKEPQQQIDDLRAKVQRYISQIESRLYSQETRAGYLNSLKTLNSCRDLLQMLNSSPEDEQIKVLKKMVKQLKPISKIKYC